MENIKYEDKDICMQCGGRCCKKCGCDYFVSDFDNLRKSSLKNILDTGNVSIVAALSFKENNAGELFCLPFLYLRARNVDRGVVDLFSMKKRCYMLKEDGCSYSLDQRPSGGASLIPSKDPTSGKLACYDKVDRLEELKKWEPYQSLLSKAVKTYTGKSVNQKLREDVQEVLYQLISLDVEGVSKDEIRDLLSCLRELITCFPEEYELAKIKAGNKKANGDKALCRKKLF